MIDRIFYKKIWSHLAELSQMVFLAGPRQCGKTTFVRDLAKEYSQSLYFNWDIFDDKSRFLEDRYFYQAVNRTSSSKPLVILDEIHKFEDWKNYLKGVYDRDRDHFKFLVSGSGRLDLFQKGGDSLAGRYFLFHLWPFSLAELVPSSLGEVPFWQDPYRVEFTDAMETKAVWEQLKNLGGFPDPYLSQKKSIYTIWSQVYKKQLLHEDIRNLSGVQKIEKMELLLALLPLKVGNPLSYNSLSKDLQVSFESVKNWLGLFEQFFLTMTIPTWSAKVSRSIVKEKKVYLFDYPSVKDEAACFENMVACELFKGISFWNDLGLGAYSLHYIKNREGQEVDFLICESDVPKLLLECKLQDTALSKPLLKFAHQFGIRPIQLVSKDSVCVDSPQALVVSAYQWLPRMFNVIA